MTPKERLQTDKIKHRVEILEKALKDALWMCTEVGNFANGNTHQGIDEGEVMANREIDRLTSILEQK